MGKEIWNKVNYELLKEEKSAGDSDSPTYPKQDWLIRWERIRPFVDLLASLFWSYAILQVFVFDVDRTALGLVSSGAQGLGNFRILVFLGLLVLAGLLGRGLRPFAVVAYVIAFPAVVLLWKIPKILIKSRSVVAFLAVANVVVEFVYNFRHLVVVWALWVLSAVMILAWDSEVALAVAMVLLAGLLVDSFWRTIRFAIRPARFLQVQGDVIDRAMDSDRMLALAELNDDLRSEEVKLFNADQQEAFTNKLANGVLALRVLGFWAYQLDRYRRSSFAVMFNFAGYVVLLLNTFATLTLINWALFKIDPGSFTYVQDPSLIDFGRYVLASFSGGEIEAVKAHSDLAGAMSLVSTLFAVIFIFGLVLAGFVTVRQGRQEEAARETIRRIDQQGERLEQRLEREYGVTVEEAVERLAELQYALLGVITFLASRVGGRAAG